MMSGKSHRFWWNKLNQEQYRVWKIFGGIFIFGTVGKVSYSFCGHFFRVRTYTGAVSCQQICLYIKKSLLSRYKLGRHVAYCRFILALHPFFNTASFLYYFLQFLNKLIYFKATQDAINELLAENHMAAVRHLKATEENSKNFAAKHSAAIPPLTSEQRVQLSRFLSEFRRRNAPNSYAHNGERNNNKEN